MTLISAFLVFLCVFLYLLVELLPLFIDAANPGGKIASDAETMIGEQARIIDWQNKKGTVRYDGEIWKAISEKELELEPNDEVTIQNVEKLNLTITQ